MEPDVTIREVMTRDFVGVSESDTVADTVEVMREARSSSAVVLRGDDAVGIVTEWDLVGLLLEDDPRTDDDITTVMSSPVISASANATLADAAATMAAENIRNLIVTDVGETVGVLTQRDVIAAVGSSRGTEEPTTETMRSTAATMTATSTPGRPALANGGGTFSRQGICENCGALAESLWEQNGQMLCENCHSV